MDEKDWEWVDVVEATFNYAAGNSIFKSNLPLGNTWTLELENGELIDYPVRYIPFKDSPYNKPGHRVGGGWYRRRLSEDALPAPKRVKRKKSYRRKAKP